MFFSLFSLSYSLLSLSFLCANSLILYGTAHSYAQTLTQIHINTHLPHTRTYRAETNRQVQSWFSESDVSDINESDSRPASPVTVLEAVDGVQPELQHTSKESELVSKSSKTKQIYKQTKNTNLFYSISY